VKIPYGVLMERKIAKCCGGTIRYTDRKLLNVVTVLYDVLMDREITEDYSVSDHR
jgi:hypothetical protein